ncbi:MAG: SPASM domain-containing protein [archaeon]
MNTRRPCAALWKTPTIDWNGRLYACCYDATRSFMMGDLRKNTFDEIWFGGTADKYRMWHISGDFHKLKSPDGGFSCATCAGLGWPVMTDKEVVSYLDQTGRRDSIKPYLNRVCRGWNKIDTLLIETTDYCNLNCIMCEQKTKQKLFHTKFIWDKKLVERKGYMGYDLWASIIDDLVSSDLEVRQLTPIWLGELLMHKDWWALLAHAFEKNYNLRYDKLLQNTIQRKKSWEVAVFLGYHPLMNRAFEYMQLDTNGLLLGKKDIDNLFSIVAQRSLRYLVFSIDAATESTYRRIRRTGDFGKLIENIKYALKKKSELMNDWKSKTRGRAYPIIILQFIAMEQNKHEVRKFINYWKRELGRLNLEYQTNYDYYPAFLKETIFIRRLGTSLEKQKEAEALHAQVAEQCGLLVETEDEEEVPRILRAGDVLIGSDFEKERHRETFLKRRPCAALWKTPVVRWNGKLTVCCFDPEMELEVGDLHEFLLSELWNSDEMQRRRLIHIRGEFHKIKKCWYCQNLQHPIMTDKEIKEYLANIGREDEYGAYLKRMQ